METAIRETVEEAGICRVVPVAGFRQAIEYTYRDGQQLVSKCAVYFLGRCEHEAVTLSAEHTEAVWATAEAGVRLLQAFPQNQAVLIAAARHLQDPLPARVVA